MHDRAVQTLGVVLDEDLPIALCLVDGVVGTNERANVESLEVLRCAVEPGEVIPKGRAIVCERDEDASLPFADANPTEGDAVPVEVFLFVVDRRHQIAVE